METLLRSRSAARGWLTRASKALDDAIQKEDPLEAELNIVLTEFNTRLQSVDNIQSQIELETEQSEIESVIEEAFTYRQGHLQVRIKAEHLLQSIKEDKETVITNNSTHSVPVGLSNRSGYARLPKLELPKFGGNYLEFTTFYDKFLAVVDGGDLPAVTKFTYLQSLLTGEALASIKGLPVTEDSYTAAKEILVQRYGRKERIIFAHIQKLLSLQCDCRKSSDLWQLYDTLQTHIRCLETLGVTGDTYGVILTPLVLSRIPSGIRLEWAREGEGRETDLAFLLEFLYKEVKRRERSQTFQKPEDQNKPVKGSTAQPSVAAFHTRSEGGSTEQCNFCSKTNHKSNECYSLKRMKAVEIRDKARQLHLCFICFGKHFARKCNQKQGCPLCNGWHNQRLCTKGDSENVKKGPSPTTGETAPLEGSGKVLYANIKTKNVTTVMQVVKTTMRTADGEKIEVNLLFDGGSDRSFITQNLVKKLKIAKCGEEKFAFASFGGTGSGPRTKRKIYDLNLGGVSVKLAEIPVICSDMFRAPVPTDVLGKFSVEFGEDFSVSRSVHIDILVGLDYYWQLVKPESIRVDSLVAQKTRCGWMLSGAWQGEGGKRKFPTSQFLCLSHVSETMIRNMWELESLGITDHAPSQADPVMEKFNSSVCFEGGRYTVSLPWKENFILSDLIDNEGLARKRLQSLSRKLEKKPELRQRYDQSLADLENEGIIVEVPENEMDTPNPVFYLPHRPVVKESSTTTKVRPVFDASAQGYNGLSLNDCLETGPSLVPNLVAILMRFRRWKIAFSSDITKAFLQIRVKKQDQDVHRFLWEVGGRIRVMRFDRVPFGNKASPFLLNATIKQHLSRFPPSNVVSELNLNLYVDDWLSGADTIDEAYAMMTEARRILSLAGLPLAKWTSNCEEIQEKLFSEFEIKHVAAEVTKLLGLKWINSSDCFSFDGIDTPKNVLITKRVVLSCIARLFDPLGLLAPFTMAAKIIFQVLWMEGLDWDMKIPDTLYEEFEKWLLGAGELRHWNVPRCYVQQSWSGITSLEIHVFCDASEKGYGACAYLKIREAGSVTVTLVTAKARVAPLKKITLPRLELMAALLGARLMRFIQRELQLPSEVTYKCYTDSMIVLGWIKGDPSRWKQFVSNRTREIQQETDPHSWSHCPGTDNPADLLTRGMSADSLMGSLLWLNGPIWLSEDDVTVPGAEVVQAVDLEALALEERQITQCVSVESDLPRTSFPISRWSSLRRATGVMGWVLRFLDQCTKKRNESSPKLTNEELLLAHDRLVRTAQMESFGDEIKLLKANKLISRSSPLYKLFPFIGEDGLLRAKCRLNYSDLSYDEKFPIILPKGHFSLLLCRDTHVRLKHAGVNQMLSTLRAQFWIVGLRSIARRTKWECLACKTIDAKACQEPAAPLMEARSKQSPPFSVVGLDYAGPVYCTDFPNKKFYVLLFTCAVVRAVHLELVESMSLPVFLLAFRKFVARRGIPTLVYSDNAKTFQNASPELFKVYGSNCPRWRFSAPRAPWWGGWWERMVKNMKWALKKTIGNKCLDRSELEATLTEVEACINSRPLTFVGDCIETGHPLTPFHFLLGRSDYLSKVSTEPVIGNLLHQHRLNEARLAFFWKRWKEEYLKQLPLPKRRDKRGKLQLGSVVLVREDNSPRLCWPIGVIEQLIEGKDGVLRTVRVKTKTGSFVRPIQRIHDLELNAHPDTSEPDDLSEPVNLSKTENATVTRYGRVIKTPTHII